MLARLGIIFCFGILHLPNLALQEEGYLLRRQPKVGQAFQYEVKLIAHFQGNPLEFRAKVLHRIIQIDPSGIFHTEVKQVEQRLLIEGIPQPKPDSIRTVLRDASGILVSLGTQADPREYRFENLLVFYAPDIKVKPGTKWSLELKEDTKRGTPLLKVDYEVLTLEKLPSGECLKIAARAQESGIADATSAQLTYSVSVQDGSIHQMKAIVKKAPLRDAPALDTEIELSRIP